MPWLRVNHTRLCRLRAVPTPDLALEVHRGSIPGHPGAKRIVGSFTRSCPQSSLVCQKMTNPLPALQISYDRLFTARLFCIQANRLRLLTVECDFKVSEKTKNA